MWNYKKAFCIKIITWSFSRLIYGPALILDSGRHKVYVPAAFHRSGSIERNLKILPG